MLTEITIQDVEKAISESRENTRFCITACCVLAQIAKRVSNKGVTGSGFSFVNLVDGERVYFTINNSFGKINNISDYFDSCWERKSAEEIYNYYEAQNLLKLEYEINAN